MKLSKRKYKKVSFDHLAKKGNKSVEDLMHKCVAVKKKGCKK